MAISLEPLGLSPDSLPLTPLCVPQVSPTSTEQAAALLQQADRDQLRLLIIGHGSKVQVSQAEAIDLVVSTQKLTRVIDHAAGDLTVTAEAGLTFAELQAHLAPAQQMLALDPAFPQRATLGGIVATTSTGARRLRYGGVRDMLLGFTVVRSDGQIAHAGGRVVKNVAGYDLMKLFCGAWGSLGLITEMTWRLYPQPAASASLCLVGDAAQLAQAWTELRGLAPVAADICLPATSEALGWGRSLSLVVQLQGIPEAVSERVAQAQTLGAQVLEPEPWPALDRQLQREQPRADLWRLKLGLLPTQVLPLATWLHTQMPTVQGCLQIGTGLGELVSEQPLDYGALRGHCDFVSVLQGADRKNPAEIWGYSEDTQQLMQRLKQRFDPQARLVSALI